MKQIASVLQAVHDGFSTSLVIAELTEIDRPKVSWYLTQLYRAGLVERRKYKPRGRRSLFTYRVARHTP